MMMASTVQVLCPNGRRQGVKINANSKLLQVLDEVCQKQGFLPSTEYKLMHGRKQVDISSPFRFANIPNNAKLELVKCDKARQETNARIVLQLETGERLQHSFAPSTSLWDILVHWESQDDSSHLGKLCMVDSCHSPPVQPICIYMVEEVIGEMALKDATLRKLGLSGGNGIIRLVHRPIDDLVMAEILQNLEKENNRQAKLTEISMKRQLSDTSTSQDESKVKMKSEAGLAVIVEVEPMEVVPQNDIPRPDTPMDVVEAVSSTIENEPLGHSRHTASQDIASLNNIPGVQIFTPEDFNDLSAQEQQIARALAQRILPRLGLQSNQETAAKPKQRKNQGHQNPSYQPDFRNFKFPEESKGKDVYRNELSDVKCEEFKTCDRQTVVYSLDEVHPETDNAELPEDFFEVTENDLKKMMAGINSKPTSLSEGGPLMTRAMRQADVEEQLNKYERTIIRVQFPDRMVLQGVFRPSETVFRLEKFVKDHLENNMSFYLYTAPPRCVLKDKTCSLFEMNLVPASVVHFGSTELKEHYLSNKSLAEVVSQDSASKIVEKVLVNGSVVAALASSTNVLPRPSKTNVSSSNSPSNDAKGKDPKTPKWFTKGKK